MRAWKKTHNIQTLNLLFEYILNEHTLFSRPLFPLRAISSVFLSIWRARARVFFSFFLFLWFPLKFCTKFHLAKCCIFWAFLFIYFLLCFTSSTCVLFFSCFCFVSNVRASSDVLYTKWTHTHTRSIHSLVRPDKFHFFRVCLFLCSTAEYVIFNLLRLQTTLYTHTCFPLFIVWFWGWELLVAICLWSLQYGMFDAYETH